MPALKRYSDDVVFDDNNAAVKEEEKNTDAQALAQSLKDVKEKNVHAENPLLKDLSERTLTLKEIKETKAYVDAHANAADLMESKIDIYLHLLHTEGSSEASALYETAEILKQALLNALRNKIQKKPKEAVANQASYKQLEALSKMLSVLSDADKEYSQEEKGKALTSYLAEIEIDDMHRFGRNLRLLLAFIIFTTVTVAVTGLGGTTGVVMKEFILDSIKYWKSPAHFFKAMHEAVKHLHPKTIDYVDACTVVAGIVAGAGIGYKAGTLVKNSIFKTDAVVKDAKAMVGKEEKNKIAGGCKIAEQTQTACGISEEQLDDPDLMYLAFN